MKIDTLNIIFLIVVMAIIISIAVIIVQKSNEITEDYKKQCSRYSVSDTQDNCICPCDEPSWIEKKLNLLTTCDGWIVDKNESC